MTDWPEIIRTHGPAVWKTVFRLLDHEADAADCYQQTFLTALEHSASGNIGNWRAMLVRMATARALDRLRARYRQKHRITEFPENVLDESSDVQSRVRFRELTEQLRFALTSLEAKQAEVFCLVCIGDYSHQEAADQLGITPAYAAVLLQRARARLSKKLRAFDPAQAHRT